MQQLRAAAFARSYLVVDECSWGLPVAVRLLLARRHAAERGRRLDATDIVQEISNLNKRRQQAVVNDRAPLVRYGLKLTEYCLRLEAIVSALKMVLPSYLSPSGGSVPLFDARELKGEADARPENTGRRLQEVCVRVFTNQPPKTKTEVVCACASRSRRTSARPSRRSAWSARRPPSRFRGSAPPSRRPWPRTPTSASPRRTSTRP